MAKNMQEMGLDARLAKKLKVMTTDPKHSHPIAPRLFETENHTPPEHPGEVLVSDITYFQLGESFIYLAVVMDLYNREILQVSINLRSSLLLFFEFILPDDMKYFLRPDSIFSYIAYCYRASQYYLKEAG